MAKFLTTADISASLQRIIREADKELVLISPYIKTNPKIKELLEQKARSKTHVRLVYGKRDLSPEESEWLSSVSSIELCFRQNLHAKCYLNEKEAILTSMNLYQFSEQNNDEMGILVSRRVHEDTDLYTKIYREAEQIAELSEKVREVPKSEQGGGLAGRLKGILTKVSQNNNPSETEETRKEDLQSVASVETNANEEEQIAVTQTSVQAQPSVGIPTSGFCIRCQADLAADPTKPYCDRCYRTWNRYKNPEYEENHCHICGEEHKATLLKPACLSCYRKYKDVFEFATG